MKGPRSYFRDTLLASLMFITSSHADSGVVVAQVRSPDLQAACSAQEIIPQHVHFSLVGPLQA